MREIILHYLWLHKCFDVTNVFTSKNEKIEILHSGQYLQNSGPDFFNAQLIIGNQKWAGNVELHVNSSDWYSHQHETDKNYDNVILHVVWNHDVEIYRKNKSEIPVFELKRFVSEQTIFKISNLLQKKSWINCENSISHVSSFTWLSWKESLFFERLERKSNLIFEILERNHNDWEATFFVLLAKNFGLNINGNAFFELAQCIPFSVIRKESYNVTQLEALFLGASNLLAGSFQDEYVKELQSIWDYQKIKYNLTELKALQMQFFKLRPDNFPTIRLAQLASLYVKNQNLLGSILKVKKLKELNTVFDVKVSPYWLNHYNLDKITTKKTSKLSTSFIDLIAINAVLPIQFAYSKYSGGEITDECFQMMYEIKPEKNSIVERFKILGVETKDAFDSQSLLQLKNEYCDFQKCLKCKIGIEVLQKSNTFD